MNCLKKLQLSLLCLLLLVSVGCASRQEIDIAEHQEALELVDQATLHLRRHELDRAEAAYNVALQIAEVAAAVDGLGCVAFMRGDLDEAETYFVRAYEMDSAYSHSLGNLALLYEVRGEYRRAEDMYRRAIEELPGAAKMRNNYAMFLLERGRSSAAAEELLQAESLSRDGIIKSNLERISR